MKKMKKNNSVVIFTLPVAHLQAMWLNTDLVAHNRCYCMSHEQMQSLIYRCSGSFTDEVAQWRCGGGSFGFF